MEARAEPKPWHLVQQWANVVTATLERLQSESSVIECLGLMSISFNEQWRAKALGQIERDPAVLDRLSPSVARDDNVDNVADANQRRPIESNRIRTRALTGICPTCWVATTE